MCECVVPCVQEMPGSHLRCWEAILTEVCRDFPSAFLADRGVFTLDRTATTFESLPICCVLIILPFDALYNFWAATALLNKHYPLYKDYISETYFVYFLVVEFLHGRHVLTLSRSSSGHNLRIQILHKLTHKMQVRIPVAYKVCEVKPVNWICVYREEFISCGIIINYKLKVRLVVIY